MVFTKENFERMLGERDGFHREIARLETENRLLQEKIQCLMKKLFGRSSEKLSPDQLELGLEELRELQEALEAAEAVAELAEEGQAPSRRGKRKPLDARIPKDLPTETVVIEPDEVKENPELWKRIGEERTELLDVTPARFFLTVIIRPKYKKIGDRSVVPVVAPAPKQLIENSHASAGLVHHIILNKYCDHLPLYRQEQIFKQRFGVEISRKTMGGWMFLAAQWLSLIYEKLRDEIRASGYIQADYLREVLEALPTMKQSEAADWTPARWKSSREKTSE